MKKTREINCKFKKTSTIRHIVFLSVFFVWYYCIQMILWCSTVFKCLFLRNRGLTAKMRQTLLKRHRNRRENDFFIDGINNTIKYNDDNVALECGMVAHTIWKIAAKTTKRCGTRVGAVKTREVRVQHANTIKLNHYHYYNYTMCWILLSAIHKIRWLVDVYVRAWVCVWLCEWTVL